MRRIGLHIGFVICGLVGVFLIKNLNPPAMNYQIDTITTVDCIRYNLSGITHNPETNTFFVVSNSPEKLAEITTSGKCIRSYELSGFDDTEDIFYLGLNKFLIVQEKRQSLDLIELKRDEVHHLQSMAFEMDVEPNDGLEGVVYNVATSEIYLVTETPQKILRIADWQPMKPIGDINLVTAFWASAIMNDYSSITDSGDGLLILSHESNRLLKLDYTGTIRANLDLITSAETTEEFVQPEGVAVDKDENIYIVGEPNQLHIYKKKPATGAGFLAFADE